KHYSGGGAGVPACVRSRGGGWQTQLQRDAVVVRPAIVTLVGPAMLHVATHGFHGWCAGLAGAATWTRPRTARGAIRCGGHIGALPPPTHDRSDALDQAGLPMADANRGGPASP